MMRLTMSPTCFMQNDYGLWGTYCIDVFYGELLIYSSDSEYTQYADGRIDYDDDYETELEKINLFIHIATAFLELGTGFKSAFKAASILSGIKLEEDYS